MIDPALHARIAASLYMIVVVASTFALISVSGMIVRGDTAATAANIIASEQMFRLAFVANLIAAVAYTAVVAIFYSLFKPVNPTLSIVAAFIGLSGCASSASFMLNQLGVLTLLGAEGGLADFSDEQVHALARQSLRLGGLGNSISLVFFGFYCLSLGSLVLGARFMPRFIGVFLLIAGVGWLIGNLGAFIAPDTFGSLSRILLPVSGLGELLFALWLLVMGVSSAKWKQQADAV